MRKHFLILMLLTLLPLAGFADNISILPANVQREYGAGNIPLQQTTATAEMLNVIGELPNKAGTNTKVTLAEVAAALQFILQDEIDATDPKPGSYDFTLVTKDGYNAVGQPLEGHTINITGSAQLQILKKDLADNMIQAITAVTFNGEKKEPAITVKIGNETIDNSNFDIVYGDATHDNIHAGADAGYVKVSAKAESNYRGSAEATFQIKKLALTSVVIAAIDDQVYTRSEITPTMVVTGKDAQNNGFTLRAADYTATFSGDHTNVGTYKIGLEAANDGDFTFTTITAASSPYSFKIVPKEITLEGGEFAFVGLVNFNYNGQAQAQAVDANTFKFNWIQGTGQQQTTTDIKEFFDFECTNNTNVGVAKITATAKVNTGNFTNNYKGSVFTTYYILPRSINGAAVAFKKNTAQPGQDPVWDNASFYYDGREIQPGTVAKDGKLVVTLGQTELKQGTDFIIVGYGLGEGDDNTNASITQGQNEKYASVTIKGIGNYDAVDPQTAEPVEVRTPFIILKQPLNLTATEISTFFGVSPASKFKSTTAVVEGENIGGKVEYKVYEKDGNDYNLVAENQYAALTVSNNKYYYTATWSENPAPQQNPDPTVTYDTQDQIDARVNYDLNPLTSDYALITVNQAALIIVPDNKEKTYSAPDPTLTYSIYKGEVAEANKMTAAEVAAIDWIYQPVLERADALAEGGNDVKYDENDQIIGYDITIKNQTGNGAVAATSYTFTLDQKGTLKINPFPITITAADQTILYGGEPNTEVAANSHVWTVNQAGAQVEGEDLTVTFSPAATAAGLIERGALGLKLTWDENGSMGEHPGALHPTITNKNFKATSDDGKVTVTGTAGIELIRVAKADLANATVATLINEFNTKKVNVTIKSTDAATTTFKKNQWYTMVLPFETDTKMISEAFGYAIVDLLRTSNEDPTRVYFDLHMNTTKIPANTPFLLKAWDNIDMETTGVTFNGVTIQKAASEDGNGNMFAKDAADNYFIGTYEGIDGLGDGTHGQNVRVYAYGDGSLGTAGATYYLRQLSAYIALKQSGARVFVQDLDENGTTVIKELNLATGEAYAVDGWYTLNGVKLQGAPTEKGIYINNGKKVVLK